jgi:hypothetical protein
MLLQAIHLSESTQQNIFDAYLKSHPNADKILDSWAHVYFLVNQDTVLGFCLVKEMSINHHCICLIELFDTFTRGQNNGMKIYAHLMSKWAVVLPWQPLSVTYWIKLQHKLGINFTTIIEDIIETPDITPFCHAFLCWNESDTKAFRFVES